MTGATLPPGFRFHPTDEELVGYYLRKKVEGEEIELEVIPVVDFYKHDPWELPDKSFLPRRDMEWFFFCPRDKKYPNGMRTNRATKAGYWKATGKDRKVVCESSITGYRKTLVFYKGRAPLGNRTDWVMHEYRLSDDNSLNLHGTFALCRVVKRNGFNEEVKAKGVISCTSNNELNTNEVLSMSGEYQYNGSNYSSPASSPYIAPSADQFETTMCSMGNNSTSMWVSPEFILDSSKEFSQGKEIASNCFQQCDAQNVMSPWQPYQQQIVSSSSSYSNFTETGHDDIGLIGCVSPYPGGANIDCMGYSENADMFYSGYDTIDSLNYQNLF